ncbi:MAG: hypothetical protein ACREMZ_11945 [Gemmatimonadales bacterium]
MTVLLLLTLAGSTQPLSADEIPYFARKYRVACTQCHVAPPKLNAFGEAFVAAGYEMPSLRANRTWPFAVWVSGRSDSRPPGSMSDDVRAYLNRVEIISGGQVVAPWLTYFVEWRPVSQEGRSDGSLLDRSGRFEDLFLTASQGALDLTAGQFRQVGQVDVSRRIGISEPLLLSASLPGSGTGTSREIALRAFSPGGRSPSIRLGLHRQTDRMGRWSTYLAVPFSGEFSIPLTSEARSQASNELELNPKGILVESFLRSGLASIGAHVFYDPDPDRYLVNAVTTGSHRDLHWTGILGVARSGEVTRGRWSVEGEVIPEKLSGFVGLGGRVEDQGGDAVEHAFIPYLNAHFPGTRYTIRLTIERRLQRDRNATFIEIGTVF